MRKILFTVLLCISVLNLHCSKIQEHKVPEFMTAKRPTPELVYQCAKHYKLQHINIVVAQSILETGHYKSDKCINYNNLFGLYDSKNKKYYRFPCICKVKQTCLSFYRHIAQQRLPQP